MKNFIIKFFASVAIFMPATVYAGDWAPAGDKIMTRWGKSLTPETVWQSYPRPQLRRGEWQNLNGLWDCTVTGQDAAMSSVKYDKEILVPFCYESALSGIAGTFGPDDMLWYKRSFRIDSSWAGKNVLLHFGAVDYACDIYVNGNKAGSHVGGNNPFSFDITKLLKKGENTLVVSVTDPTDAGTQPRGKQVFNPKGIWYTPVSGIWKTVWLEPVAATSVKKVVPVSDIANGKVSFDIELNGAKGNENVVVEVFDNGRQVASYEGAVSDASVIIPNAELWTPATPKLYDFTLTLTRGNKELDKVDSYCALRKVSIVKDVMGNSRMALNDKALFQYGPLDQGWWPDGLLTPPSESAMIYDMIELKKMGFNTIRKHIKVEPDLFYYYADSLGLMIWQDMPSGFMSSKANEQHVNSNAEFDWDAPAGHEELWKAEYKEMVENLRFFPCITTWVVFNEGWGQFRTPEMVAFATSLDHSRLINGVTGWTDRKVSDIYDIHNYPSTSMKLKDACNGRISVLGEFGGLGLPVPGHMWKENQGWGYRNMDESLTLMNNYTRLVYDLEALAAQGLSAAIYTQTTDVEVELNGLMTYDREVMKLDPALLHVLHSRLYEVEPAVWKDLVSRKDGGRIDSIEPNGKAAWSETFEYDGKTSHFSLWLNSASTVAVRLNGVEIFNGPVRQTRNYNHFNITDYADVFKVGANKIEFDIKNDLPKRATMFDFAITTF